VILIQPDDAEVAVSSLSLTLRVRRIEKVDPRSIGLDVTLSLLSSMTGLPE
jgi:hypothetical protein